MSNDHAKVIVLPPLPYVLTVVLGILFQLFLEPLRLFPETWIGHALGWPMVVAAMLLIIWARQTMSRAGESPNVYKPTGAIVSTGTYAFTRNPMYLSMTLLYVGIAVIVNTAWPLLLLPAVLMLIQYGVIKREERYLQDKFGPEYQRYRTRVC